MSRIRTTPSPRQSSISTTCARRRSRQNKEERNPPDDVVAGDDETELPRQFAVPCGSNKSERAEDFAEPAHQYDRPLTHRITAGTAKPRPRATDQHAHALPQRHI